MISADGGHVLIFNGEIYNYKELAAELGMPQKNGCEFGDTAIVLKALQIWGKNAFARFLGMWSILFYDRSNHTLLVSRDRLGIKPLYYFNDDGTAYFASEIKAILVATKRRFRLNPRIAVPYLTRGLLDTSHETFFDGIFSVAPGTFEFFDLRSRVREGPRPYWQHPFTQHFKARNPTSSDLKESLLNSVRIHLRSDVPIGVLLSGGIDSSAILGACLHNVEPQRITILSVVSDDRASDESKFIKEMAAFARVNPVLINVSRDPMTLLAMTPEATWSNDQPLCGASDLAHLLLMQTAKKMGLKVLLSGQGADELFGGYNKFFYFYLQQLWRDHRYGHLLRTILASALRTNTLSEFRLSEARRYLHPATLKSNTYIRPQVQHVDNLPTALGASYQEREFRDITALSLPQLLHFEDRLSMSQSVEVRVPFLDNRLVELAAAIPPDDKFRSGWTKSVLRDAIAGLVPPAIRFRRDKKGFNIPEATWMRHEFVEPYCQMLASPMRAHDLGIIDQSQAISHHRSFLQGRGILNARHLFRLYLLEQFLIRFEKYLAS